MTLRRNSSPIGTYDSLENSAGLIRMRFDFRIGLVCLFGLVAGCGKGVPDTSKEATPPPHGGTLAFFQDSKGRGVIEVVKKQGTTPISAEVSFFFYQADDNFTPYESIPEKGVLVLDAKRTITLQLDGDEGALVTPSGPVLFGNRDVEGELKFEIDGEPKVILLGVR